MALFSQKNKLVAAVVLSLTAGFNVNSFAAQTVNTAQASTVQQMQQTKRTGMNFEQRYQKMLARDLAAANAKISAAQAVTLAQQQVPNIQILGVHYSDGQHRGFNKNQNATATQSAIKSPSYRIMAIKSDGKPQMIIVDATSGTVTQKDMQKWANKANQKADKPLQQRVHKPFTAPAISATRAMQLAADKVGGKVIAVQFGHGKHHAGKHGNKGFGQQASQTVQPNVNAQQATNQQVNKQPKDRNYRVKVVKGQEVYLVKVNAQTGVVSDVKSMKDMPKRFAGQQTTVK